MGRSTQRLALLDKDRLSHRCNITSYKHQYAKCVWGYAELFWRNLLWSWGKRIDSSALYVEVSEIPETWGNRTGVSPIKSSYSVTMNCKGTHNLRNTSENWKLCLVAFEKSFEWFLFSNSTLHSYRKKSSLQERNQKITNLFRNTPFCAN